MKLDICFEDNSTLSIQKKNEQWQLPNKEIFPDVLQTDAQSWHVLYQNKTYTIHLIEYDKSTKQAKVSINGKTTTFTLKTELDNLLHSLGLDKVNTQKMQDLKAPMPGLIVDVKVKQGQAVNQGDPLLILEAMKMENVIKATGSAVVKNIKVNAKDKVEKNTVLIEFE
jgi:acetyl/propionyl-CoA carboxylase alpha subunit